MSRQTRQLAPAWIYLSRVSNSRPFREAIMAKTPKIKRRQFLAGVVAAAPVAGLAASGKAVAQTAARAPSVPTVPPNENILPPAIRLTEQRSGSDFMVDFLKTLDIDYIASLPA